MNLIKLILIAALGIAGLTILMSLLKEKKKPSQMPITLVTLANELWLKNSGRNAADREKREMEQPLPVAADFKATKKGEGTAQSEGEESRRGSAGDGTAQSEAKDGGGKSVPEDAPGRAEGAAGKSVVGAAGTEGREQKRFSSPPAGGGTVRVDGFRKEFIEPYASLLAEQKADTVIDKLLGILSESAGLSSIVADRDDEEFMELVDIASVLAETKLITHTETVVRLMLDMCRETFAEPEKMMPVVLVTAIGHDIGKTREGGHVKSSVEMLSGMIPDDVVWKRRVIHAVTVHHGETDDQLSVMLKACDMKARGYEMAAAMQGADVRPFEQWFNSGAFISKYIEPEVNITQMHSCNALSLNGVVYVKTDYLYDTAYKMSRDLKIMDVRFFYPSERDNVIRSIVKALRKERCVHESLKGEICAVKYELVFDKPAMKKLTMQLVPLKGEAFDIKTVEGRKADFLVDLKELKEVRFGRGKDNRSG